MGPELNARQAPALDPSQQICLTMWPVAVTGVREMRVQ